MEPRSEQLEAAVRRAVEDAVGAEVRASAVERRPNPSAAGHVAAHPLTLTAFDTSSTLPDFLPLVGVSWPEPVKAIWKTFKANSTLGLFSDISRAWITIDNKLILWDYSTGRDFVVYDEIPEIIVAVGGPVTPTAGVFQPHISLVFPVATPKTVHLLGLCDVGDGLTKREEIHVLSLGFSVMAPTLLTKLVGLKDTGRVFAAGADGCLYELKYNKESTPILPKVRLINHSFVFGSIPILNAVGSFINTVKQTWLKETPPLRDLAIDQKRKILFTLDAESNITLWKITEDGVTLQKSLVHDNILHERYGQTSVSSGKTTLVKIFSVSSQSDNCSLIAIASSGEQYRYTCLEGMWGSIDATLSLRDRIPSYIPSNREISVCFVSDDIALYCHSASNDERASDAVAVVATPNTIIPPHHNARDVVTHLEPVATKMVRVDAIAEVPTKECLSPNELCSQVTCSPKQFVFAHRHGISVSMQLRPVDTLHMILSSSSHQKREGLLQRFASVYSPSDYCCMLIQIAVGCTNVPGIVKGPYIENGIANSPFSQIDRIHEKAQDPLFTEQLGCQLVEKTSQEAQRLAKENLRNAMMPSWHEAPSTGTGARQIIVQASPFASGVLVYIGRALYTLWQMPMGNCSVYDLTISEIILSSLLRLLNYLKKDVWSESLVQPKVPFLWDQSKVTLTFPPNASSISPYDLKVFQSALLHSAHSICERVLQTIKFAKQTAHIPLSPEDSKLTFSQVVCDQSLAHRLARYIGRIVLSSDQGIGFSQQERFGPLAQLQHECPYFFSSIDVQEYKARIQINQIFSANDEDLPTVSEIKKTDWESSVSEIAASLWSSGALQGICQQLKSLKKEDTVVKLLLHAASQIDPMNSVFEIYLAERGGTRGHGVSSALNALYQEKVKVLEHVVAVLEEAWNSHRSVVDTLLGGPLSSGSIWQVEPADEMAHCFLFDWICVPREDQSITTMLKETLSAVRSPFLELYLIRNASTLGEQYAHYLRRTKKNFNKAIEVSAAMAQASLEEMPREKRIHYRIRCWEEAKECAAECNSEQLPLIEQRLKLMEGQLQMSRVILDFINSGLPQLDRRVNVDGTVVTERQVALEQLELIESQVLSISQLLQIAGMFCAFGGAEIQLDVLSAANVTDASLYAACIERAFQRRNTTVEATARRLLEKFAHLIVFPIGHVAKFLEAHAFMHSPEGSTLTVDLLSDCGVERNVIFSTISDILRKKDTAGVPCEAFNYAGVKDAFLVHSLAVALHRALFAPHHGPVQAPFLNNAMSVLREGISGAAYYSNDEPSRRALATAEEILGQCQLAAARHISRFDY